jgi:ABC-type multidrug transport system ATPase subunit
MGIPKASDEPSRSKRSMTSDGVLETKDLQKYFRKIRAVDGVDLSLKSGEICGLIGSNGSGETTLIRLFLGLHRPTTDAVRLLI